MHVLMNRSIECFIRDTYGATAWRDIAAAAGLEFDRFEALMTYDDALIYKVIDAAAAQLSKRSEEHTSELQSRRNLVCRLLLEKKKKQNKLHKN